ncbi:MAG: response regulator transcription factor [Actinomycetota bacterium]|nr:response regulator transcription factor [Actinomycetota bacterium]
MTIRVLLADDQALLRHGFKMIIDAQPDMEVVGEAADGAQAIARAAALKPDVVLMDIRMPGTDGIEATRHIAAQQPEVKVLILTTFDLDEYAFNGLRAGASGFLLKNVRTEELLAGIRAVASGDAVLAPSTTRRLLDTYAGTFQAAKVGVAPQDVLAPLTQRERQIFTELAAGGTNQEIAERFTLSETTVKTHVARVLAKLNLRDRVQVVIFAYENGFSKPTS